jgi:hypothetical protein
VIPIFTKSWSVHATSISADEILMRSAPMRPYSRLSFSCKTSHEPNLNGQYDALICSLDISETSLGIRPKLVQNSVHACAAIEPMLLCDFYKIQRQRLSSRLLSRHTNVCTCMCASRIIHNFGNPIKTHLARCRRKWPMLTRLPSCLRSAFVSVFV